LLSISFNNIFGEDFSKQYLLNLIKDRFDIQRYESLEGYGVEIINDYTSYESDYDYGNDVIEQVVIQDFTNPLNEYREDRKIFFALDSDAKRGSFIKHKNRYWLVLTKVESNEGYLNAKITECEHILKWINEENTTQEQPAYIIEKSKTSVGITENKHMVVGDTGFIVWVQNNSETQKINRDKRFIINDLAFKTVYVDRISRQGVIGLIVSEDQINENYDNTNNGIADDITEAEQED
jgi:hypothetical protein